MPVTPETLRICRQAWEHLRTVVLVLPGPDHSAAHPSFAPLHPKAALAILKTPACRTAEDALNHVALTGDAIATNAAANAWVRAVKDAMPTVVVPACTHLLVKDGTGTYCWRCNERVETLAPDPEEAASTGRRSDASRRSRPAPRGSKPA